MKRHEQLMNRFRSDSASPPMSEHLNIELSSIGDEGRGDDERDCLIQSGHLDNAERSIRNSKKYSDIDKPPSSSPRVRSLTPFTSLFSCCKQKRNRSRVFFLLGIFLASYILYHQQDIRLYFGLDVFPPYPVSNTTITIHGECEFENIRRADEEKGDYVPLSPLPCFKGKSTNVTVDNSFALSRSWNVVPDKPCINISSLDSNVCVEMMSHSHNRITCFPSFMIIGFEKASTTELLLWLSYHPNLLGKWAETRFFSKVSSKDALKRMWRRYISNIPEVPGGKKGIGKYWSYEKTPSYILNNNVAMNLRSIMPSIRLIVMVRNPTKRAYSAFAMYTQMVSYYDFKDSWNLAHLKYNSLVMRNLDTGVVKFAIEGGPGGSIVPKSHLPREDVILNQRWKYISFPPDPQDFHDFLLHDRNFSYRSGGPQFNYRQRRIVMEGYYAQYIKEWQAHFPTEHFLIVPMETLWNSNTMQNLNILQAKMGIPIFDYRKVTTFDEETKRYELNSASTYFLEKLFNTGGKIQPMLQESKKLLDELYCESNRNLKGMLGGNYIKGYSCT